MKVAIQGQQGSYHHQATTEFFGNNVELVACQTFKDAFAKLVGGNADKAVIAIENSLFGSINTVYDLLLKHKFWISGETYLRIEHCLIGLPGATTSDIKAVYSQLEALAQCEDYLESELPDAVRLEHYDTAASVEDIKKWNDKTKAAIASEKAAKLHGLQVIKKGIEDNKQNYTRFVVLQPEPTHDRENNKTSIVLTTKSDTEAGTLYQALGTFAKRDINLSMLQSRPLVGKAWHYLFYLDIDIGSHENAAIQAFDELGDLGFNVKVLGSYRRGR